MHTQADATQSFGQQASTGTNTQVALQVGFGNSVSVTQTANSVANASFAAQFGSHNTATVTQK